MRDIGNKRGDIFVAVLHLRLSRFQLAQPCDQPPLGWREVLVGDVIGTFAAKDALESVENALILASFAEECDYTNSKNGDYVPQNQPRGFKILP